LSPPSGLRDRDRTQRCERFYACGRASRADARQHAARGGRIALSPEAGADWSTDRVAERGVMHVNSEPLESVLPEALREALREAGRDEQPAAASVLSWREIKTIERVLDSIAQVASSQLSRRVSFEFRQKGAADMSAPRLGEGSLRVEIA